MIVCADRIPSPGRERETEVAGDCLCRLKLVLIERETGFAADRLYRLNSRVIICVDRIQSLGRERETEFAGDRVCNVHI